MTDRERVLVYFQASIAADDTIEQSDDRLVALLAEVRAETRREALEEAAVIVEDSPNPQEYAMHGPRAVLLWASKAADAIRSLMGATPTGGDR